MRKSILSLTVLSIWVLIGGLFFMGGCAKKKGITVSYTIDMSEKDAICGLTNNNGSIDFVRVIDKASEIKKQFPDSSLIDIFYAIWEKEMPSEPLWPFFSTYENRDMIKSSFTNEDVYLIVRHLISDRLYETYTLIQTRLDYLGCRVVDSNPATTKKEEYLYARALIFNSIGSLDVQDVENEEAVEKMITTVGEFNVWETYRSDEFAFLRDDERLQQILSFNERIGAAEVGFLKIEDKEQLTQILNQFKSEDLLPKKIKIMYGRPENGLVSVFLLQTQRTGGSGFDGSYINKAKAEKINNDYQVTLSFNAEGAKIWSDVTKDNIDRQLAISIDDQVYYAPFVMSEITGGKLGISAKFTKEEAENLAIILKSGALPVSCKIID